MCAEFHLILYDYFIAYSHATIRFLNFHTEYDGKEKSANSRRFGLQQSFPMWGPSPTRGNLIVKGAIRKWTRSEFNRMETADLVP